MMNTTNFFFMSNLNRKLFDGVTSLVLILCLRNRNGQNFWTWYKHHVVTIYYYITSMSSFLQSEPNDTSKQRLIDETQINSLQMGEDYLFKPTRSTVKSSQVAKVSWWKEIRSKKWRIENWGRIHEGWDLFSVANPSREVRSLQSPTI